MCTCVLGVLFGVLGVLICVLDVLFGVLGFLIGVFGVFWHWDGVFVTFGIYIFGIFMEKINDKENKV